jgi:dTDP-4-amino-4,6-dideoxygalactose transaminase
MKPITSPTQTEPPRMEASNAAVVLFHPHVPEKAIESVAHTLRGRWIGQGPQVDAFEDRFSRMFCDGNPALAVGSGTDALHLAYILAGLSPGDEVITPVFTCTATNIPLLYMGTKIRFADVQKDTLNIDTDHVARLITDRTRAIVCVHYGGLPCDMSELQAVATANGRSIPIIEDAAHALGATYNGRPIGAISDYTMYSFQAIKHITTGDGGMLTYRDRSQHELATRLRWFGIDRPAKQLGTWDSDIKEVGYKYQMTDIGAAMGMAGLDDIDFILSHRRNLLSIYEDHLKDVAGITLIGARRPGRTHAAWLCTALVERRRELQAKLLEHGIESDQVHYRNDRYSIFGERRNDVPNMDALEDKYLVLPLHTKVSPNDVERICGVIRSGW